MNKELILKYKAEFDHCLNGGEIAVLWRSTDGEWEIHTDFPIDGNPALIVINDDYFTLRVALAEGKTVQSNFGIMGFGCPDKWTDMSGKFGYKFEHKPECYRIKPDEPKFKEWRWFWDEHINSYRTLAQYSGKGTEEYPYKTSYNENYKHCELFIGKLPTNLQN